MSNERTYSDAEIAEIIDRATRLEDGTERAPGRALSSDSGLTLAEIQKIGTEVGISPDAIAQSARSLSAAHGGAGAVDVERRVGGLPLGVGGAVELERPLTEREWSELVVVARDHFNAHGKLDVSGSLRSWRNGNLRVQLEPSGDGQRLRLRTFNQNASQMLVAGAGMVGGSTVLAGIGLMRGDSDPIEGAVILAVIGVAFILRHVLTLGGWADRRRAQMEDLMARAVEMASRALPGGAASDQLAAGHDGAVGPDSNGE